MYVFVRVDNAVYSPLKENADYQEIESTPGRSPINSPNPPTSPNPTTSPNHYEMEHVYESEEVLESYYAEVGPLLDLVSSQDINYSYDKLAILEAVLSINKSLFGQSYNSSVFIVFFLIGVRAHFNTLLSQ